jgi:hypothetical protein
MGRYSRHCGRNVVSQMWVYCPYCGNELGAANSSPKPEPRDIASTTPDIFSQLGSEVDRAKMPRLRKALGAAGSDFKSRSKAELVNAVREVAKSDPEKVRTMLACLTTGDLLLDF